MSHGTPTVYIVDDDPSVLRGLQRLFDAEGYGVECFEHPRRMLERPPGDRHGCVVMDLRMPGTDGVEAVTRIMASAPCPVLILTTYDTDGDVTRAIAAGAELGRASCRGRG